MLDCGDILILPVDNAVAFEQMTQAYTELSRRRPSISNPNFKHPRLMTLGGDHSVALGALRALNRLYGRPIAVVHFDSHLDTWAPPQKDSGYPWWSEQIMYHHGSVFWMASTEGLIANGSSVHAGLRTRLSGLQDLDDDDRQGFLRISADEIDDIRPEGIVEKIYDRIGITMPVYLSFDIDVIDPGLCPGTGTPASSTLRWNYSFLICADVDKLGAWGMDHSRGHKNIARASKLECGRCRCRRGQSCI